MRETWHYRVISAKVARQLKKIQTNLVMSFLALWMKYRLKQDDCKSPWSSVRAS